MAASVGNRQFGHLETVRSHTHYPPPITTFATTTHYSSDEEDEKQDPDWWKPLCNAALEIEPLVRDQSTADKWIPRSPALIRLTGKHPFNSEPALSRLMHHGFITPTPIHYVRNHGSVPRADWSTWTIDITGLVRRPLRLTMDQLVGEFPSSDIPVTLACAGNRRKEQNMVRQTAGFNWGPSAISTSVWRGVRLRHILKHCGIMSSRYGALNVCFEGAEDLPGGGGSKYGTSLRREVAMDPSRDVLIAYMQNGELLLPDHGFPVRIIIPGFIGGRMVKWLKKITVTTHESDNYYHYKDNRVLPSHVDGELANSEAWWYKPEYIINELNINSVITTPGHDEILPINSATEQKGYTVKGYAYSGGGKKITRVEITLDSGETWQVCNLDCPEKPNKYGKYWCWCFWSLEVEVFEILSAKEIAVRAWDETLNTQPEKLIWNLMGMMNNCWFKVKANICRPRRGELGVVFEHPTQAGAQSGGWMARKKSSEPTLKKSLSSPFMNTATKQYSISELRRHSTRDSAWIVVHGYVYDCTAFLKDHPGGADSILINAGTDCTEEFDAIHSDRAKTLLDKYRIGELISTGHGYTSDGSVHGASNLTTISEAAPTTALSNPREKVEVQLVSKKVVSSDVRLFRFALPSANLQLGLPVGKHIFLYAHIDGKLCVRAYTPTSPADTVGYLELLVKIYFKNPKFPKGGLMSQYLESLPIGATLDLKGPLGHIEYTGRGNFVINGMPRFARRLAMVAAGTGITPVYQVMHAVMRDQPGDETEMWLVYACRTKEDILLKEELDGWAREYPGRLKVLYLVGPSRRPEEWEKVLSENIPMGGDRETLALVCGPPVMVEVVVVPNLVKMKYEAAESVLVF